MLQIISVVSSFIFLFLFKHLLTCCKLLTIFYSYYNIGSDRCQAFDVSGVREAIKASSLSFLPISLLSLLLELECKAS